MTDHPEAEIVAYLDGIAHSHADGAWTGAAIDVIGGLAVARSSLDATLAERDWLRKKLADLIILASGAGTDADPSRPTAVKALHAAADVLSELVAIDREALAWRQPGLAAAVRDGLAQAARGQTTDQGDFARYLDDGEPEEASSS